MILFSTYDRLEYVVYSIVLYIASISRLFIEKEISFHCAFKCCIVPDKLGRRLGNSLTSNAHKRSKCENIVEINCHNKRKENK